jgi:putative addiction module component (TIGR02574 family)
MEEGKSASFDRSNIVDMPRDAAEVLKDAMALPLEARAALIGPLVDSLDTEVDENAEEAWREEIGRRLQEIDSGAAKLLQWDEARRRLSPRR